MNNIHTSNKNYQIIRKIIFVTLFLFCFAYFVESSEAQINENNLSSNIENNGGEKIYIDPLYKYQISLPNDWYISPTPKDSSYGAAVFYNYDSEIITDEGSWKDGLIKIQVSVAPLYPAENFQSWVSKWRNFEFSDDGYQINNITLNSPDSITIAGNEGSKYELSVEDSPNVMEYLITGGNQIMVLGITPANLDDDPVVQKILSTITFDSDLYFSGDAILNAKNWFKQDFLSEHLRSSNQLPGSCSAEGNFPGHEAPNSPIELFMPFKFGETWTVGGDIPYFYGEGTHCNSYNDYYATDWNRSGDDGAAVLPVANGVISGVQPPACPPTPYGCYVQIDHALGIRTLYAHLSGVDRTSGTVAHTDQIGKIGSTGNSTGSHLHLRFQQNNGGYFSHCYNNGNTCPNGENPSQPQSPKPSPMNTTSGPQTLVNGHSYTSNNGGTTSGCPAPNQTSPSAGAVLSSRTVNFSWEPIPSTDCDFNGYIFRVKDVPNMDSGGTTIKDEGEGGTSRTETFGSELDHKDLYWGVKAANAYGGADWSVRRFQIESVPQTQGNWNITFYNDKNWTNQCNTSSSGKTYVFYDWGENNPIQGCNSDNWSARFVKNNVYLKAGSYNFGLGADDWGRIWVNDDLVVDHWDGAKQQYESRLLPAGYYNIKIEYADTAGNARIAAWWWGPDYYMPQETRDDNQWYAQYWGNKEFWWDPIIKINEGPAFIDHPWELTGPGFGLPENRFSSRFERKALFDCGRYRFQVNSDDGFRLYLDNQEILNFWVDGTHNNKVAEVDIETGTHDVKLEHYENLGTAKISLDWTPISFCSGVTLFDNINYGVGEIYKFPDEYSGSLPLNIDDLSSSIWIAPNWSARVFENRTPNLLSGKKCFISSDSDLTDDNFDNGNLIINQISSIETFPYVTCLPRGDVNRDGKVNVQDIIKIIAVYQTSPPANPRADLNFDGVVNVSDIIIVVGNYPQNQSNSINKFEATKAFDSIGAYLSITPEIQSKYRDENFEFTVILDTGENMISGFDMEINFDPNNFEVSGIEKGSGINNLNNEVNNKIDNENGIINYGAVTTDLSKSITGSNIEVIKVNGKVKTNDLCGYFDFRFGFNTVVADINANDILDGTTLGRIEILDMSEECFLKYQYLPLNFNSLD